MRIKLDENLPAGLAVSLNELGHDAQTVWEEDLADREDAGIWEAAQGEGRLLITQDLDFSDVRKFAPGTHHRIVLVRLRSPSRWNLIQCVEGLFRTQDAGALAGCFVVATERKVRVLRPEVKG